MVNKMHNFLDLLLLKQNKFLIVLYQIFILYYKYSYIWHFFFVIDNIFSKI